MWTALFVPISDEMKPAQRRLNNVRFGFIIDLVRRLQSTLQLSTMLQSEVDLVHMGI